MTNNRYFLEMENRQLRETIDNQMDILLWQANYIKTQAETMSIVAAISTKNLPLEDHEWYKKEIVKLAERIKKRRNRHEH